MIQVSDKTYFPLVLKQLSSNICTEMNTMFLIQMYNLCILLKLWNKDDAF